MYFILIKIHPLNKLRAVFLIASFSFCLIGNASDQKALEQKERVKLYVDSTGVELDKYRLDKALYYVMRAEELFIEYNIEDPFLEEYIQTSFISTFKLIDNKELLIDHLRKMLLINNLNEVFNDGEYERIYGELASQYMLLGKLDSAIMNYKNALREAIKEGDPLYISSALNNIGMFKIRRGEWEESIVYFNKAVDSLNLGVEEDSLLLCSIRDNQSDYYFHIKDTLTGVNLIEQNMDYLLSKPINNKEGTYKRVIRYGIKLCNIYLKQGRYREVENLVNKLVPSLNKDDKKWHLENSINLIRIRLHLAVENKNNELESRYFKEIDSLMSLKLEISEQINKKLNSTIGEYMLRSAKQEIASIKEKSMKEQKENQLKLVLLIISLLLFGVVTALVIFSFRRKLEIESSERILKGKELRLTELEKEKLSIELSNQEKDISNMVMQNAFKRDWNLEVIKSLEKVSYGKAKIESHEISNIIRDLKQKSTAYEIVNLQEKSIKEVNNSFYSKLNEMFPNLTPAEREMCKFIRMKLGGNEIAAFRNINHTSVRKLRQRLRKKLNMNPNQDLYDFIAKI